jgi:hypothetical protein
MTTDLEQDLVAALDRAGARVGPVSGDRADLDRRVAHRRRRRHGRQLVTGAAGFVLVGAAVFAAADDPEPATQIHASESTTVPDPSTASTAPPTTAPPVTAPGGALVSPDDFAHAMVLAQMLDVASCSPISASAPRGAGMPSETERLILGREVRCMSEWGEVGVASIADPDGTGPDETAAQWGELQEITLADGTRAIGSGPFGPYAAGLTFTRDGLEVRLYGEASLEQLVVLVESLHPITSADYADLVPVFAFTEAPEVIDPSTLSPEQLEGFTIDDFTLEGSTID